MEAIKYLSSEAKKHPQFSDLFYKYYFRSVQYAINEPELYEQTEKSLRGFLDHFDKQNEFPNEYQKLVDFLYTLYINLKDGNSAKQTLMRLNKKISPERYDFLFIQKYLAEKSQSAHLLFNISQTKKDIQYIYDMMIIQFITLAMDLERDFGYNIETYELKLNRPYKKFEDFNHWKDYFDIDGHDFNETDSTYDFVSEDEVEIFKRVINADFKEFLQALNSYYFVKFPLSIGFNLDFLLPNYNDLDAFGRWFSNKPYTKKSYPSVMCSAAHDLANEFISNYTINK
jgi:hypothetical protein